MSSVFTLLNDYYDKVYVLSVRPAEWRRKIFEERFKGLNYTFFYGADKNNFSVEELIKKNIYSEEI